MKEQSVDKGIVSWAKEKWPGMVIRKLSSVGAYGSNGDPDRLFFWNKKLMLIEMKGTDGECTDLQIVRQEEWRKAGAYVIVVDTISAGRQALATFYGRRGSKLYAAAPY